MTSEEVKELLRQLAKDTEEIGDIRSRTVRIRLDSIEEEEPESGEDVSEENRLPDVDDLPEERPVREEPAPAGQRRLKKKTAPVKADEDSETEDPEGPVPGSGSEAEPGSRKKRLGTGLPGRLFGSLRKKKTVSENEETEEKTRKPENDFAPGSSAEETAEKTAEAEETAETVSTGTAEKVLSEEDELVTRYMDEDEKEAYLAEKASQSSNRKDDADRPARNRLQGGSANGSGKSRRSGKNTGKGSGKGGFAGFIERQRNTPVEPAEFESDAWMFSEAEAFSTGKTPSDTLRKPHRQAGDPEDDTGDQDNGKGSGLMEMLRSHRPGLKEMTIIGSVIVLAVVIIAVVLTLLSNRKKRERVRADEGLQITVEKEPSGWCKSGEVVLAVDTESPIQSISVNNQPIDYSEQGKVRVVFEADRNPSQVTVVCDDATRNATVGFAKIDSEDPAVTVAFEDGKTILSASDDLSGADEIWYGTEEALSDVPYYQLYEGPFEPVKGKLYTYFAKDKAGNTSVPVTTNLSPAESISLSRDEVSIFAGESYELTLTTKPEKAFLNGLTWTSSDETVATVDAAGVVTALSDGKTTITAQADGVNSVSCTVQVRSEVSVTISAVGDMTLGEDASFSTLNNFTAVYTMYGPEYFLANVKPIFEADDITFANFEGTLTDRGTRQAKEYAFRGDPSYTQVLVDGSVEAVTLANNHSYDYGEESHADTQKYLDEAGIEWCEGDKIIVQDVNGVRMALIGIYVLADGAERADQVKSCIAAAKEQGAQLIVVAFHWGNERETKPDEVQKMLAHLAIDSGADLVVGHHPHVLQGIEKYSGKYICYSLANFCFGGNSNPSDKDTIIFQQTFRIMRGGSVEDGGVSVIPCSVSSVSDWNNYQPTPATGTEAERIMTKLNDLCTAFGTSF